MKLIVLFLLFTSLFAGKPELFLLKNYSKDMNVSGWYMSEKLDGVRAYWDGEKLISRSGKIFAVPLFFTKDFPKIKLDGELWTKRDDFSNIASIVNRKKAHEHWNNLTYNVFEVPHAKGGLLERLSHVKQSRYIRVVKQVKIKNKIELDKFLKLIEEKGGEGIVVRNASLPYYSGRKNSALKMKNYLDTECEVVDYTQGNGRYENLLGALVCRLKDSRVIKIGSGFTNEERIHPPQIGAIITFKYYGLTSKGNPRFPVYLRERK